MKKKQDLSPSLILIRYNQSKVILDYKIIFASLNLAYLHKFIEKVRKVIDYRGLLNLFCGTFYKETQIGLLKASQSWGAKLIIVNQISSAVPMDLSEFSLLEVSKIP